MLGNINYDVDDDVKGIMVIGKVIFVLKTLRFHNRQWSLVEFAVQCTVYSVQCTVYIVPDD